MTNAQKLATFLLDIKAIKLSPSEPFTWSSGLKSPIYCDNRMTLSYPEIRSFIKKELASLANTYSDIDGIAGVATAGIPHGALLADALSLPFIYVRSGAKKHGRQNQIEGNLINNGKYLVIEDLVSTGGSSLEAVKAIQNEGAISVAVLSIFTYGFTKATEAFELAKIEYKSLLDYSTLLEVAIEKNYITETEKTLLASWNSSPEAWSNQYK